MSSQRRYRAFISYAHSDERWARWLQRALETYRLPRSLRAKYPQLPARLFPIFRDRDELASGTDLSESIQQALGDSEALIVICSPVAAGSRWVNEEIRRFQAAGKSQRIFCLLVSGSPNAGAVDAAFPPALLQDASGQLAHEPLAADVTPGGDGKRNAMLKIAAGLLGVGIDELKRRDAQRQARLWSAVAAGSLLIAAITIGLAIAAVIARQESEIRRQQAENLIGFMLGDLRGKLEPIGKLDLLDAVGDQAMSYFAVLGNHGTPQELLDRAKALRQIGDVRFNQGKLGPALRAFQQSLEQARALHEAAPGNNDYLFELGQAEFWVGYVAWQRNDLGRAFESMQRYMRYSRQLRDRAPGNQAYRMELAYAHSNLGSVARAQGHAEQALSEFKVAAEISAQELASRTSDPSAVSDLADIWSWIGSTQLDLGRLPEAEVAFVKAVELVRAAHEQGKDPRASARYADLVILLADAKIQRGDVAQAARLVDSTKAIYERLVQHDPDNAAWRQSALTAEYYSLSLLNPDSWTATTRRRLSELSAGYAKLAQGNPTNEAISKFIAKTDRLQALDALVRGDIATALDAAKRAHELMARTISGKKVPADLALILVQVDETLGKALLAAGNEAQARRVWTDTLDKLGPEQSNDMQTLTIRRLLAIDLGHPEMDARISARLAQAGFNDPRFDPSAARASKLSAPVKPRVVDSSPSPAQAAPVH